MRIALGAAVLAVGILLAVVLTPDEPQMQRVGEPEAVESPGFLDYYGTGGHVYVDGVWILTDSELEIPSTWFDLVDEPTHDEPAEEWTPPPPPPLRSITITVRHGEEPVAGATVEIHGHQSLETAADGSTLLETRVESVFSFTVEAPGYLPAYGSIGPGKEHAAVSLSKAAYLTGRVRLESGAPASGAKVCVFNKSQCDLDKVRVTDSAGRFESGPIVPGKDLRIVAALGGRGPVFAVRDLNAGRNELDLQFAKGGALEGRVLDNFGKPVSGIELMLALTEDIYVGDRFRNTVWQRMLPVKARADANGRYAMRGLRLPGAYRVVALSDGKMVGQSDPIHLTESEPRAERDVHFKAIVDLRIKIVLHDGTPVRRAKIGFDGESEWLRTWPYDTVADGDAWRIRALRPGTYDLLVWPEGGLPTSKRVVVNVGPTKTVTLRAQKGVPLAGRLVDDLGKPIAGYDLLFHVEARHGVRVHVVPARTDEKGRFQIEGLQRATGRITSGYRYRYGFWQDLDGHYLFGPAPSRYPGAWIDGVKPGGPARDYVLPRRGVLRLRLPAGPKNVIATIGSRTKSVSSTSYELGDDRQLELKAPEGRFDVRIGSPPHVYYLTDVEVAPAAVLDVGDAPLARLETVRGRVTIPSGEPARGGKVTLLVPRFFRWQVDIGKDGAFALPHVPVGRCTISLWVDGFGVNYHDLEVRGGMGAQEFRLPPPARLRLKLVDGAGMPVSRAVFTLKRENSVSAYSPYRSTNRRGVLDENLAAGTWTVESHHDKWTVTLRSGETTDVVLQANR